MAGIQNLVLDFPTLLPVHDMIVNEKVEMFSLTVPDRLGATRSGFFRLAIHCPNPMNQMPSAYVLNHQDIQRGRYIIAGGTTGAQYDYSKKKLPGTNNTKKGIKIINESRTNMHSPTNLGMQFF